MLGWGAMIDLRPAAWVLGILISVVPFSFLLWLLYRLPKPIVASHRRWPLLVNCLLMTVVASSTTVFLVRAASAIHGLSGVIVEFLIQAAIYGFGLALLLRQFCGVYEDFIITVGAAGLLLWKTSYTNIAKADSRQSGGGEAGIRIETARGGVLWLTLPANQVERFYAQVRKKHAGE